MLKNNEKKESWSSSFMNKIFLKIKIWRTENFGTPLEFYLFVTEMYSYEIFIFLAKNFN